MDDEPQLSGGILERLLTAAPEENNHLWEQKHVVQILSLKKIGSSRDSNSPDRYRLVVSDGDKYTHVMLATQLTRMVEDGQLTKNTVVAVEKLTCNMVQNKRLLIFLALSIVKHCESKIGDPVSYEVPGQGQAVGSPSGVTPPTSVVSKPVGSSVPQRSAPTKANGPLVMPIESLSPYQNKWTIKARVIQKSDIRHWSNTKGEGKLFNVTFMDESGEISATGFNQSVDDFYEKLEEGKTYYVTKARVGLSKKKFTTVTNEYELSFSKETIIEECTDPSEALKIKYNFHPIGELESAPKDGFVDVIGVVQSVSDVSEITTKTGKQLKKRELNLVDQTMQAVKLTLWGKQAENYQADDNPVLAFKGLRVGDFNGRSLSMVNSSLMAVEPDIPEAHVLRGWYDASAGSLSTQFKSFSGSMGSGGGSSVFKREEILPLQEVRDRQMGSGDSPEYFHCRSTIVHIKADNIAYPACKTDAQGQKCNKKVTETNGGWHCEKCSATWEEPDYRYMLSMSVADYSGQAWFQGFNEAAEVVFGMTANDLMQLRNNDENSFMAAIAKANCQTFNFTCQAKTESYNDNTRIRYGIRRIEPLNYREEAKYLRDILKSEWAK